MDLYKVTKPVSYEYSETILFREAYLDFYSKSLVAVMAKEKQEDKPAVVFSKRLQVEQKAHNEMLKTIMQDDPAKHARTANLTTVLTEGGNGLADIGLDPMRTIEEVLPTAQKDLLHEETKHLKIVAKDRFEIGENGMVVLKRGVTRVNKRDSDDEWEDQGGAEEVKDEEAAGEKKDTEPKVAEPEKKDDDKKDDETKPAEKEELAQM